MQRRCLGGKTYSIVKLTLSGAKCSIIGFQIVNRMKTLQKPILENGEDESTFSLADFHVSHSVMPGSDAARQMTATSGRTCTAALTKSSPIGSWLKTLLESSRWSSRARYLKWQVKQLYSTRVTAFEDTNSERPLPWNESAEMSKPTDMKSSRYLFQLAPLGLPTDETESSSSDTDFKLLNTPTSVQTSESPESLRARMDAHGWKNGTKYGSLQAQVLHDPKARQMLGLLPTPLSQGLKVCDENGKTQFIDLSLLPTPRANVVNGCDLNNPKLAERHKSNLEEEVAKMVTTNLLPTTIARDWKGGTTAKREDQDRQRTDQLDSLIKIMESQVTPDGSPSRLSPLFTEEMMGFPLMWTALPFLSESGAPKPSKPTATPSSPK